MRVVARKAVFVPTNQELTHKLIIPNLSLGKATQVGEKKPH